MTNADSSFVGAMTLGVEEIGRTAKLLRTRLESPGDAAPADKGSRAPVPGAGLEDGISLPPTPEDWVARLLTRQKLDREQRSSTIQPPRVREAFGPVQTP